jgi:hypothetical protein
MSDDISIGDVLEAGREQRSVQAKRDYLLISLAAGGIAFAVHQTSDAALGWNHALWGIAVLCWGGSIGAGLRRQTWMDVFLYDNSHLLMVHAGVHPMAGSDHSLRAVGVEAITKQMEKKNEKLSFFGRLQERLFMGGACAFAAWHVVRMIIQG